MCDKKFEIKELGVRHIDWGVEYIDETTFKSDNFCDTICEENKQKICEILFSFIEINKKRIELRKQKINNRRKVFHRNFGNYFYEEPVNLKTDDYEEYDNYEYLCKKGIIVSIDKIDKRIKKKKKDRLWDKKQIAAQV